MFLKECKYVVKEKKIPKYIIDDIEISSDSDKENSNEDNSDKKNSDEEVLEKIQIKKNNDEGDSSGEDSSKKISDDKNFFFSTYINIMKNCLTIKEIITIRVF